MKTHNLLILEGKINEALEEIDALGTNEGWVNPDLVSDMAKSAEAVYDTTTKTEKFLLDEDVHIKP